MRVLRAVSGVLALAALLAGCAVSSEAPAASPPSSPSIEPVQPEPTKPTEPEAADIVISGDGFDILDSARNVLFSHRWPDEVGPAVEALDLAFGTAPNRSFQEGDDTHIADMNLYDWGGFLLADAQDLSKAREDYAWPSTVTISTASIGDIELSTSDGLSVGASVAGVRPNAVSEFQQADGSLSLVVELTNPQIDPNIGESTNGIYARTDPSATSVIELFAPGLYPGM